MRYKVFGIGMFKTGTTSLGRSLTPFPHANKGVYR